MNRSGRGPAWQRALAAASISLLAPMASSRAQVPAPGAAPQVRYGAVIDVTAFTYRRDMPAGAGGLVQVVLDAAVLAHSRDGFADLRIVTADGRQVPYLLRKDDEPQKIFLPPLEQDRSNRERRDRRNPATSVSRYVVRLPYSHLPSAQLVLNTTARVFSREVRLDLPPGDDPTDHPRTICRVLWSHADPQSDAAPLTADIGSLRSAQLDLVVNEGDNAPLPLGQPTLLLPAYRLRFMRPSNVALQLVYGNRDIDPPRYDVALEPESLLQASAADVTVGPEHPASTPAVAAGLVFWVALAGAVVVLALLIARLLPTHAE